MAIISSADIQKELTTVAGGPGPRILRSITSLTTTDQHLVRADALQPGRVRWVSTTNTDDAATQAAAIVSGLA